MNQIQASVLKAILRKDMWGQLGNMLSQDVFTETSPKKIYSIIERLHTLSGNDLDTADLALDIEASYKINTGVRDELLACVKDVDRAQVPDDDMLKLHLRKFVGRSIWMKQAEYITLHVDDDDFDGGVPARMASEAVDLLTTADTTVVDFTSAASPSDDMRTGVVPLGMHPAMDAALDGGTGNGELAILLAPSGVGKTSLLINSAVNAAILGKNVLDITLEIKAAKCVTRADQKLTGMTKTELITNPWPAMKNRKSLVGNLWFKDWSHRRASVADIRSLLMSMACQGKKVDYLVVDYMELLRPEIFNKNQPRFNYSMVAQDLRALANELDINILTAWQTNRAAAGKHVLAKEDVGEDWGVVKIADIILGLNQNNEELREKVMRINIIKQREGTNRGIYYIHCDLDRMIIKAQETAIEEDIDYAVGRDQQGHAGRGDRTAREPGSGSEGRGVEGDQVRDTEVGEGRPVRTYPING